MIVVDASAVLAILFDEPEAEAFLSAIGAAGGGLISPVNLWEVLVRAASTEDAGARQDAEDLLRKLNIEVAPVGGGQARRAADAFQIFGRKTPAGLNLGDCFAYVLAAEQGEGLLYKGNGFPKTDVKSVLV